MLISVDPEMTNSDSLLNWKTVTKGRRSARSKSGEDGPTSGKPEHVPIKKRRLLFQPSSPQTRMPSLCHRDSSSPQQQSSSPPLEDNDQLPCQSPAHRSLNMYRRWQFSGIEKPAKISFGKEYGYESLSEPTEHNYCGDFSGIELLAAAASMDADFENVDEVDEILKDSSLPKCSNSTNPVTQSTLGSECSKSENPVLHEDVADHSLLSNMPDVSLGVLGSVQDETNTISISLKVDRRHWDLNTVMDTWDQPYKVSISGDTPKDATNFDMSVDHAISSLGSIKVESSDLNIEENKSQVEGLQETFIKLPTLEDSLPEPSNNNNWKVTSETLDQATEKVFDCLASAEKMGSPMSARKIESSTSVEKIDLVVDTPRDLEVCLDSHDCMIDGANSIRSQEICDSPYEDGELRGSCLHSWEDNELDMECVDYESDGRSQDGSDAADLHGSEIVDDGSEGSHGIDRKSSLLKKFSDNSGDSRTMEHSSRRYFMKDSSENNEIAGKNESNEESVIEDNEKGIKKILLEQRNGVNEEVGRMDQYTLKTNCLKLQSFTQHSSLDAIDGKNSLIQKCRARPLGGSDSRSEKDSSTNRYTSRYRPTNASERGGTYQWTSWHSRNRHSSTHHGVDDRSKTRVRSMTGDSRDTYGRLDFQHQRQAANYSPKAFYRPSARSRSTIDSEDSFGVYKNVHATRWDGSYRRRNYSHIACREFGENFEPLSDDATPIIRIPYTPRRERSISPYSDRGDNMPLTHRRSRSRSRARSPMTWLARRDRDLCGRKQIINPGTMFDHRIDKMSKPFLKSTSASDFGDEGMATPRGWGRSSPPQNGPWIDDRYFEESQLKRRQSPARAFRCTQRFEAFTSPGRPKSDEYFKPTIRPRRFSFMSSHDRECKFGTSYEERKYNERHDMLYRRRHHVGNSGSSRRIRHMIAANEFETSNSNERGDHQR